MMNFAIELVQNKIFNEYYLLISFNVNFLTVLILISYMVIPYELV